MYESASVYVRPRVSTLVRYGVYEYICESVHVYIHECIRVSARVYVRIGVARNATGVAAMRFRSSTGVYRVYCAVIVAVW